MLPPDPEARQRALDAARGLVRSLGRFSQVSLASFCRNRRDESLHVSAGSLEAGREGGRSRRKKYVFVSTFSYYDHKKSCKGCDRGYLIFE